MDTNRIIFSINIPHFNAALLSNFKLNPSNALMVLQLNFIIYFFLYKKLICTIACLFRLRPFGVTVHFFLFLKKNIYWFWGFVLRITLTGVSVSRPHLHTRIWARRSEGGHRSVYLRCGLSWTKAAAGRSLDRFQIENSAGACSGGVITIFRLNCRMP